MTPMEARLSTIAVPCQDTRFGLRVLENHFFLSNIASQSWQADHVTLQLQHSASPNIRLHLKNDIPVTSVILSTARLLPMQMLSTLPPLLTQREGSNLNISVPRGSDGILSMTMPGLLPFKCIDIAPFQAPSLSAILGTTIRVSNDVRMALRRLLYQYGWKNYGDSIISPQGITISFETLRIDEYPAPGTMPTCILEFGIPHMVDMRAFAQEFAHSVKEQTNTPFNVCGSDMSPCAVAGPASGDVGFAFHSLD